MRRALVALVLAAACAPARAPAPAAPLHAKRVEGRTAMVSAPHPDAAAAGEAVLRQGGNAVDAAVAIGFALGVVDPSQTGLGGGGAITLWLARERRAEVLDFYPRAGSDPRWGVADTGRAGGPIVARNAAVPGTVAGLLDAHARWGRLPRAAVLAPAIALARDGFVVSPLLARTVASAQAKLAADSAAAALFLPGRVPLRPGERLVQPALARTLQRLADDGAAPFYAGDIGDRTVAALQAGGSYLTRDDWRGFRPTSKRPVCTVWRGFTVLGAPPPLSGATVQQGLGILAGLRADTLGSPTASPAAAVAVVGAIRAATSDAGRWRGDPAVYAVPARGMSHPAYAAERARRVRGADSILAGDPWAADTAPPPAACQARDPWPPATGGPARAVAAPARGADAEAESFTTHYAAVDGERSAASVTFTVGTLFGSGVYAPDGFFLNSSGANFDARTRGPDRIANSTIAPTVVLDGDAVRLVVGAAGSQYIPPSIVQVTHRILALGEDAWDAIAAPRLQPAGARDVEVETGFAPAMYAGLRAAGYFPVSRVGDLMFGGVHLVHVRRDGRLVGAADPRRDGAAAGW